MSNKLILQLSIVIKSTITPSKNPVLHGKSKHIDSKFPYFHDFMKNREINLEFCRSEEHVANS